MSSFYDGHAEPPLPSRTADRVRGTFREATAAPPSGQCCP